MMGKIDYNTLAQNIVFLNELKNVLTAFNGNGIDVLVLKGAALVERVYPHPGLRPMEDIDLLVKKEDIGEIKKILSQLGYNLYSAGEWTFIKRVAENFPPVVLDLHERIWYTTDTQEIWQDAVTSEIAEVKTRILSLEGELIYLAAHQVVHHGKAGFVCLEDVRRIIQYYVDKINWSKVVAKIQKYGLTVPIFFAFSRLKDEVPLEVVNEIQPKGFLLPKVYQFILNLPPQDDIGHFLRPLCFSGGYAKIRFLYDFFFPGKDFLKRRYGLTAGFAILLFSIFRPLFLLFKATKLLHQFLFTIIHN